MVVQDECTVLHVVKICILCQVYIYLTYSYNFVKFLYLYKYFPGNLLIL